MHSTSASQSLNKWKKLSEREKAGVKETGKLDEHISVPLNRENLPHQELT